MKVLTVILFLYLLTSCNTNNYNHNDIGDIFEKNKFPAIHDLKLDSITLKKKKLHIYFTNLKDFYDPVSSEQKTIYGLSNYELKNEDIDSVIINFSMPNRPDGNVKIVTSPSYIINAIEIYNKSVMNEVMNLILKQDSIDPAKHYLGGMNAELAFFTYGDQAIEEAFFGINSLNIFYKYLIECQKNYFGPAHFVIEKYKDRIETYEENEKLISKKLISLIEQECKKYKL